VEGPPRWTIIDAENDVSESVSYITGIFGWNGVKAVGVLFRRIEKMSITALQSEAVR